MMDISHIFKLVLQGDFTDEVKAQARQQVAELTARFPLYPNLSYVE
ncbi:hypothetical protein GCM10025858_20450 [Alicyclobacillus sacchari]|nr:hypothetical protein GCM10025858_20450 [Alicyclobacillus sacchari]